VDFLPDSGDGFGRESGATDDEEKSQDALAGLQSEGGIGSDKE
jgi:hypothetical protein